MNKLFQTLFVLLAMSNATATPVRVNTGLDSNKLLPFSESRLKQSSAATIADLYAINEYKQSDIKQPINKFSPLYQRAIIGQQELELLTDRVALMTQTSALSSGIKSKQRALKKITQKLAGEANLITDLTRSSIVAKDIGSLMQAYQLIEQQVEVLRIKNRFKNPTASGYRDLSLLVKLPDTQIIAEIQLHLQQFSTIKNGKEHDNYEQIQQIERLQANEARELSEFEVAKINKLRKESQMLYQDAWSYYLQA